MIKARCFRCGHAFQLSEQSIANDLAAQGLADKPTHYTVECLRCRRANKVSLRRVVLPEPEPADQQGSGEPEEPDPG